MRNRVEESRGMSAKCVAMLCVWLLTAALMGCGDDGFEYDDYHCNLTIDNSVHLDPTLAASMDPMILGSFCKISYKIEGGAKWFVFENNHSMKSQSKFTAIDDRLYSERRIGKNNGIFVGYGNVGSPARFYAYDAQCPNCFDMNAIPLRSHPLSVNAGGIATCPTCKRQYDLNVGGYITKGDAGLMLKPYRAETTGINGTLHVY